MVRFSDLIKRRDKKNQKGQDSVKEGERDGFRLSDSEKLENNRKKEEFHVDISTMKDDTNPEIVNFYEKFLNKAGEVRERVYNNQGISPSPILSELHSIIDKKLVDDLYQYAMAVSPGSEDMLVHTLDVMFTSLKVGEGMGYDTKMLLRLGLAAFLENVGMYKIPDSILNKTGKLGADEIAVIKKHPEMSSEILSRMGEQYKWLADVAIQIHERSDGSGYPIGLKGEQISELASIIGLVDIYVAMIKKRPYRVEYMQTVAIKSIIEASKGLFPPRIVKIFLSQVTLFPINSYVRLNNKSIGKVIATDHNQPLKPTIELVYDGLGQRVRERQVIHLPDNPLLYIERSVNKENLS
jgi:HD-GYP domain-containing protein (c-di-GMP phosphodiesterase class II)